MNRAAKASLWLVGLSATAVAGSNLLEKEHRNVAGAVTRIFNLGACVSQICFHYGCYNIFTKSKNKQPLHVLQLKLTLYFPLVFNSVRVFIKSSIAKY